MSQRKIKEEVTRTLERTITKCDVCGLETAPGGDWPTAEYHDRDETEITCRTGAVYPDSDDHRSLLRLDVCPKCFTDKLVPAVEAALVVKFFRGRER